VMKWVKDNGLEQNTMIVYMGDNGFSFGEHGLIDKRHAYEESMRVPLLVWAPGLVKAKSVVEETIMNVDLAPTFLELAGIEKPQHMQGESFTKLLSGQKVPWRNRVFYEYFWEAAFPSTPTIFAVRTDRLKYIYNYGGWDINELYDLEKDPYEMNNLIRDDNYKKDGLKLKQELFEWLKATNGLQIPLKKPGNIRFDNRFDKTY